MRARVAVLAVLFLACSHVAQRSEIVSITRAPYFSDGKTVLKAHMRTGDMYMLTRWQVTDSGTILAGFGTRYDPARRPQTSGPVQLPVDSISLLEANASQSRFPAGLQVLGAMTVLYGIVSFVCLADPKACFGSCPTFYVHDGTREVLQAEGFSASIARVLEATDVDPLYDAKPVGAAFNVLMRNEALETHVVQSVRLHAVPRPAEGRVFASADHRFFAAARLTAPSDCRAAEGDCLHGVAARDSLEYQSRTDSTDLAVRETIDLEFPAISGPVGVVLGARQTFVSTYVFYQTLAYLGRTAGEWLAQLERVGPEQMPQALGLMRELGGIEIAVAQLDGSWRTIGTYHEAGPIATDVQILPVNLDAGPGRVRMRLRMARGSWRVGYVALATAPELVPSVALDPVRVERRGAADTAARAALVDPARYLTTLPGEDYQLVFARPNQHSHYDYFLESRGYYYEWMREEWMAEENAVLAGLAAVDPVGTLRRMAPAFKQVEPRFERLFWQSRFGKREGI